MRKTIITVVGVLVFIVLILPAIIGQVLKYDINKRAVNNKWPRDYKVKLLSYQAGWFHSTAKLQILMNSFSPLSPASTQQPQIILPITIYHGPITYTKDLDQSRRLFLGLGVVKGRINVADLPLQFYARVAFNNNVDIKLQNDGFQHKAKDGSVVLSIGKLRSDVVISKHFQKMSGNTQITQFQIVDLKLQVRMPQLVARFSLIKDPSGLWIGQRANIIPSVVLLQSGSPEITINGLSFNAQTNIQQKLFNLVFSGSIRKISTANFQDLGPGNFVYSMKNIAVDNITALNNFLATADFSNANPNKMQLSSQVVLYVLKLAQGTTQNLSTFTLGTPRGTVNMNYQFTLPQMNIDVNRTVDPTMLKLLITRVGLLSQFQFSMNMPTSLLFEIMQKLKPNDESWVAHLKVMKEVGLIKANAENVSTSFQYNRGRAVINGLPLSRALMLYHIKLKALEAAPNANGKGMQQQQPQVQQPQQQQIKQLLNTPSSPEEVLQNEIKKQMQK